MDMQQGEPYPSYYLESMIDQRESTASFKNEAYWYMDQIYGWCSHSKASIMIDIIQKIKPTTIVEIGVFGGKSLIPMAYALKVQGNGIIYGIDPWNNNDSIEAMMNEDNREFWLRVDLEGVYRTLLRNMEQFQLEDQIQLIRATSANTPPIHDIDLLHIDGNHSDVTSYLDVTKWAPLVRPGGWIVVDDISWFENGNYTQAASVQWLNEHCQKMAEITDASCIWGIWVKI